MYIAAKSFKSYKQGEKKKGEAVEFVKAWADAGLIVEGKPEPKAKIETKPEPKKKKETK
jgi:hypothetical protein